MNNILECSSKLSTIGITASFLLTNKEIKTSYSIKSSKNRQLIVIRAPNHKKKKQEHDHKISNKIKNNKRKIAIEYILPLNGTDPLLHRHNNSKI